MNRIGTQIKCLVSILAFTSAMAQAVQAQSAVTCSGDADGDGQVIVSELVQAVNNALEGCDLVPITLQFQARVGDQPFACGMSYGGIGTSQAEITPADFRFYVSNVRLLTPSGGEIALRLAQDGRWQHGNVALLDFEDKTRPCNDGTMATNAQVRGIAPPGTYSGVRFVLGVPFDLNHQNAATAPSPLNLTSMFWSWNGGYKFMRIDEAFDTVRVHLGSTGCQSGPGGSVASCARPNRGEVMLTEFDPTSDVIVADLAALLADSDLGVNHPDTTPGCSSDIEDTDCVSIFENLGVNFSNGLPDPSRQSFLRVEKNDAPVSR